MSRARVQAVGSSASFALAAVSGVIGNQLSGTTLWPWITFAVVLIIGMCVTAWVARFSATPAPPDRSGATVARQLGERVRAWITREQEAWRISDPRPLPVCWHTAADHLFDRWHPSVIGHDGGPVSLAGGFADIGQTYEAVPSGRLVILGRAGAGKTVLAYRLIASLLDGDRHADHPAEQRADRVPVLFSLSAWNPRELFVAGLDDPAVAA